MTISGGTRVSDEVRVKCIKCAMGDRKTKVFITSWTAPEGSVFYDEAGRYHHHATTTGEIKYRCTLNHEWDSQLVKECWCGWKPDPAAVAAAAPKVIITAPQKDDKAD